LCYEVALTILRILLKPQIMKKVLLGLFILIGGQAAMAQPVSDNAVIPVSVTLNSILRLTVVTGGNIEFVVNTIDQYTNGIANAPRYTTNFTVASSVDFNVNMDVEDASFLGQDNPSNNMALDNVGYAVFPNSAAGAGVDGTNWNLQAITGLVTGSTPIVTGIAGNAAGNSVQNNFDIRWELARGTQVSGLSLLQQSIAPDRYVTNVYLQLVAAP